MEVLSSFGASAKCGPVRFSRSTPEIAVEHVINLAINRVENVHVHLANAYSVVLASKDPNLRRAFDEGICFPDGLPVVWSLNYARKSSSRFSRVRGPSFFESALRSGTKDGLKHFFLGSTVETLKSLEERLQLIDPKIDIVGSSSPPFRDLSDEEWQKELEVARKEGAHIIWVGLGTPKQDLVAAKLALTMPAVFICVGAAFDFTAGNLRHAPIWMQDFGLEWFYRLIQEPKRLWRRYLFGNLEFVFIVVKQVLFVSRYGRDSEEMKAHGSS